MKKSFLNSKIHKATVTDSQIDYEAAKDNQVPFILRRTSLNIGLQSQLKCQMISNFINE